LVKYIAGPKLGFVVENLEEVQRRTGEMNLSLNLRLKSDSIYFKDKLDLLLPSHNQDGLDPNQTLEDHTKDWWSKLLQKPTHSKVWMPYKN